MSSVLDVWVLSLNLDRLRLMVCIISSCYIPTDSFFFFSSPFRLMVPITPDHGDLMETKDTGEPTVNTNTPTLMLQDPTLPAVSLGPLPWMG